MDDDCYYYDQHSWKLKLRQLGRQVRKLLAASCASMRLRRRRAGYMRFRTEEEQRLRFLSRSSPSLLFLASGLPARWVLLYAAFSLVTGGVGLRVAL